MEEELHGLRLRAEEQATVIRTLRRELDDLKETRTKEKEREARRAQEDEDELHILKERCEMLESERADHNGADPEILEQLRSDMEGLLSELSDLSRRNDELMHTKDSDLIIIRDLDAQMKDYKRKYEQAKTELRSVKGFRSLLPA
jgi:chromosome segregation ATPase